MSDDELREQIEHLDRTVDELTEELQREAAVAGELIAQLVEQLRLAGQHLDGLAKLLEPTDVWSELNSSDPTYWRDLRTGSDAAVMEAEQWLHENGFPDLIRRLYRDGR